METNKNPIPRDRGFGCSTLICNSAFAAALSKPNQWIIRKWESKMNSLLAWRARAKPKYKPISQSDALAETSPCPIGVASFGGQVQQRGMQAEKTQRLTTTNKHLVCVVSALSGRLWGKGLAKPDLARQAVDSKHSTTNNSCPLPLRYRRPLRRP